MNLTAGVDPKVAVLLNANAKRVSRRVQTALRHVIPADDLFLSKTAEDAKVIARTVVDRRYRTVFTGGGDGTFVSFVTEILRFLRGEDAPRFGVLKLGTGNALAGMVGATAGEGILDDVLRARAGEVPNVRKIDLITAEGRITPFAGVGLDAAILNDYSWTKQRLARGRFKRLGAGGPAYVLAIAGRTVPTYLFGPKSPELELVNSGRTPAVLLGPDGKPVKEFAPGEVMFRGRAKICSASTVPFYGFGFKLFPYAESVAGKMHIRLTDLSTLHILAHLDQIWVGKYRHPAIKDFLADGLHLRASAKLPFQVGGDAEGYREEISLGIAEKAVELVDFSAALN